MRAARWAVVFGAVCLVVAVAAVAYAAGKAKTVTADTVKARRFVLVDAAGKVCGELRSQGEWWNGPGLVLFGENGKMAVGLWAKAYGAPRLTLYDAGGEGRAALGITAQGSPGLLLLDGGRTGRADLRLMDDGSPRLRLRDKAGQLRAALGATELETPRTGATQRTAESSLVLFDKEGKVLWEAP